MERGVIVARLKGQLFARLSLDYPDHPKIAGLSDSAWRAHVEMIIYARKYELDGVLPARIVKTKWVTESVSELLTNGNPPSLTYDEARDAYVIHGYADMQETKADIQARRQVNAQNGAKGGRPKKPNGFPVANPTANQVANRNETETKAETETETETEGVKRKQRSRPLPDSWTPNGTHKKRAQEENIDLTVEADKFRNWALANDKRYVDWNRAFSNWLSKDWVKKLDQNTTPDYWN